MMLDRERSAELRLFPADNPGVDLAMQDHHVSMGWSAARKLRQSITNTQRIGAIELLTAARALDLRAPLQPGPVTKAVHDRLRATVAGPGPDRYLSPELEAAVEFVQKGDVLA